MEELLHAIERTGTALYVMQTPWVWPALEILHFVGLSLLFGSVAVADLRLIGRLTALPVEYLPTLAQWGLAGFVLNAFSGVLFLVANPTQYFFNWLFWLKMALVAAAGLNVLAYRQLGQLAARGSPLRFEAGQRLVGGVSLLLWVGVLLAGRMLPFLGGD